MRPLVWLRSLPPTSALFLAVAATSITALGWLGWELLRRDAAAEAHYENERLKQIAENAGERLAGSLADLEAQLSNGGSRQSIDGVLFVDVGPHELTARPAARLLYVPAETISDRLASPDESAAEALEFQGQNPTDAAAAYLRSSTARDPFTRAAALAGLARLGRRRGRFDEASVRYGQLGAMGGQPVEGWPAAYVARIGRASIDQAAHRDVDLRREAQAFVADLRQGRWPIDKPTYEYFLGLASSWLGSPPPPPDSDAVACTDAAGWLWTHVRESASQPLTLVRVPTGSALVSWRTTTAGIRAAVAGPAYFHSLGLAAVGSTARWVMTDPATGQPIAGEPNGLSESAGVEATTAGLPFGLRVASFNTTAGAVGRRRLLVLVLVIIGLVLSAGWYFMSRAAAREARVARLQADFVAAVSHEFRSPLTSLSHVAELLADGRIATDRVRQQAYDVLARDTDRLRRLVEGLLDFGRFEAGAAAMRFESVRIDDLARAVVADFQSRLAAGEHTVLLAGDARGARVHADREAIGRALWNLLDNAVKYSPECRTVWVDVALDARGVRIDVRDRGLGIPVSEQAAIFGRFVRGADAKTRRIRGTGLGLAMVRQIVVAHDGEISVRSQPGEGSTFTMRLPVMRDRANGVEPARPGVVEPDSSAEARGE